MSTNILSIIRGQGSGDSASVLMEIASNVKNRRLSRDLTQQAFAKKAGILLPTYRLFERTGQISLRNLSKIALVLDDLNQLKQLFRREEYASMRELLDSKKPRKRGRING